MRRTPLCSVCAFTIHLSLLSKLYLAEPLDPLPDDPQAILPEFLLSYVDPEAFRQVRRIRLARRGQQVLIVLHEFRPAFLVDRIQSGRE